MPLAQDTRGKRKSSENHLISAIRDAVGEGKGSLSSLSLLLCCSYSFHALGGEGVAKRQETEKRTLIACASRSRADERRSERERAGENIMSLMNPQTQIKTLKLSAVSECDTRFYNNAKFGRHRHTNPRHNLSILLLLLCVRLQKEGGERPRLNKLLLRERPLNTLVSLCPRPRGLVRGAPLIGDSDFLL